MMFLDFKDVYSLIRRICDFIILCGKREFVEVIKLGILRWGFCDYMGFI